MAAPARITKEDTNAHVLDDGLKERIVIKVEYLLVIPCFYFKLMALTEDFRQFFENFRRLLRF